MSRKKNGVADERYRNRQDTTSPLVKKIRLFLYTTFIGNRIQKSKGTHAYRILDGRRVWFISDMHFDENKILKWCRRPFFRDVIQSNHRIIKNWNDHVGNYDRVYCLGDVGNEHLLQELKGKITVTRGNHDGRQWDTQYILEYRGMKILVIHDPDDPGNDTGWFDGDWIIHGHTHVNSPFIDIRKKRVNVSCEVINFSPISMEDIYTIIQESKNYRANRAVL